MLSPLLSSLLSPLLTPLLDGVAAIQRIFITLDPVLETHFPIQNTKTYPNDFDLSIDAVLPIAATTVTLYGQTASADHYIKLLSTGFVSINIDTSIVTSTVLATKDNKQRRYGVKLVGNDFIFTEDDATIDTVTDAVAAAKTLIINAIGLSNGADFFDGTLSDPILTDLTTPSNSVAWQLNLTTGNTEQAIGGGNDLTYNNAPPSTRQLFTFIDDEWEAVELWDNGGFIGVANGTDVLTLSNWSTDSVPDSSDIESGKLVLTSDSVNQNVFYTESQWTPVGQRFKFSMRVETSSVNMQISGLVPMTGLGDFELRYTSNSDDVVIKFRPNDNAVGTSVISRFSNRRIIEVA